MDSLILSIGAKRFGLGIEDLKLVGGFSDNVFESKGKREIVLKFYPSSIYKPDSIKSELDWILYLYKSGVNVTAPILSVRENYIEVIQSVNNLEECYVLAYEKAKGSFIDIYNSSEWNENFFCKWGETLGKIHSLSKNYSPIKNQEWNQGLLFTGNNEVNDEIYNKWHWYISELKELPKGKESYGMIHNDLHHKNFYIHNDEMIIFDFGDCEINWFIYDIAIVLYHALQTINEDKTIERKNFANHFMPFFIKGYKSENNLDSYWLYKLPFFLNYRQVFSYMYFSKFLKESQKENVKVRKALNKMKYKIKNDIPYIDLNFKDVVR